MREALRRVKYPGFSRDIVSFGIVKEVETAEGTVRLRLHLPGDKPADAEAIEAGARAALEALPGARAAEQAAEKSPPAALARSRTPCGVPGVRLSRPFACRLAPGPCCEQPAGHGFLASLPW